MVFHVSNILEYHLDDQNSTFGALSALNNDLLDASDFYTGAFSAEYGDVLSSVLDLKLRAGNNEKFESAIGFGLMGTDVTLEGPFKKDYAGSYLVNYRYSTISLINDIGVVDIEGNLKYQDVTFKVVLPTKKMGTFSLFGLGGLSGWELEDITPEMMATPGNNNKRNDVSEDYDKLTYLLNTGLNHTLSINKNSFIKTSLSYSGTGNTEEIYEARTINIYNSEDVYLRDSVVPRTLNYDNSMLKSSYKAAITYSNKLNTKNKIQIGTKYSLFDYDYNQSWKQDDLSTLSTVIDFRGNIGVLRNFISWKHSLNENLTLVTGLHNMNVLYNNKSTLEPRVALNWKFNNSSSINIGYGKHSNMERVHNYFAKVEMEDGSITEPNKNLDLLKANHYVLGYEKRFAQNLMAKVEFYYQQLYDLPVENSDTSFYATINESFDLIKYVDLVNEGTGKNYGIELTLERFFANNYYYLISGSLYNSTFKSLDGVERNTRYNGNYLVNILAGKEFKNLGKKRNQTLALNAKVFFGGGQKYIPLLRDAQGNLAVDPANDQYWDYEKAYDNNIDDIYYINLSVSHKFNRPNATHEIFIDLHNITNNKGRINEYYDETQPNSTGNTIQLSFFPNIMYRVYF